MFGEVAEAYERARPSYPAALFDHVVRTAGLGTGDAVLEVGAGTGKATREFVARGLAVTAVEPDPAMAAVGRRACPTASWINSSFEDVTVDRHSFALVASAQAWHWVEPDVGPAKAADALRPGGWIALFWNRPLAHPLFDAFQAAYAREAPRLGTLSNADPSPNIDLGITAADDCLARSDRFAATAVVSFDWSETYTSATYGELLTTQSDHRLLPVETRGRLIGAIASAIDDAGGRFELPYRAALLLTSVR